MVNGAPGSRNLVEDKPLHTDVGDFRGSSAPAKVITVSTSSTTPVFLKKFLLDYYKYAKRTRAHP